jgi:hypothetical protein
MTWYKKAKMVNKGKPYKQHIYPVCMYCKRLATHPTLDNPSQEAYVWKKESELTSEEKERKDWAEYVMKIPEVEAYLFSHGICSYCSALMEDLGWPETKEDTRKLVETSLSM